MKRHVGRIRRPLLKSDSRKGFGPNAGTSDDEEEAVSLPSLQPLAKPQKHSPTLPGVHITRIRDNKSQRGGNTQSGLTHQRSFAAGHERPGGWQGGKGTWSVYMGNKFDPRKRVITSADNQIPGEAKQEPPRRRDSSSSGGAAPDKDIMRSSSGSVVERPPSPVRPTVHYSNTNLDSDSDEDEKAQSAPAVATAHAPGATKPPAGKRFRFQQSEEEGVPAALTISDIVVDPSVTALDRPPEPNVQKPLQLTASTWKRLRRVVKTHLRVQHSEKHHHVYVDSHKLEEFRRNPLAKRPNNRAESSSSSSSSSDERSGSPTNAPANITDESAQLQESEDVEKRLLDESASLLAQYRARSSKAELVPAAAMSPVASPPPAVRPRRSTIAHIVTSVMSQRKRSSPNLTRDRSAAEENHDIAAAFIAELGIPDGAGRKPKRAAAPLALPTSPPPAPVSPRVTPPTSGISFPAAGFSPLPNPNVPSIPLPTPPRSPAPPMSPPSAANFRFGRFVQQSVTPEEVRAPNPRHRFSVCAVGAVEVDAHVTAVRTMTRIPPPPPLPQPVSPKEPAAVLAMLDKVIRKNARAASDREDGIGSLQPGQPANERPRRFSVDTAMARSPPKDASNSPTAPEDKAQPIAAMRRRRASFVPQSSSKDFLIGVPAPAVPDPTLPIVPRPPSAAASWRRRSLALDPFSRPESPASPHSGAGSPQILGSPHVLRSPPVGLVGPSPTGADAPSAVAMSLPLTGVPPLLPENSRRRVRSVSLENKPGPPARAVSADFSPRSLREAFPIEILQRNSPRSIANSPRTPGSDSTLPTPVLPRDILERPRRKTSASFSGPVPAFSMLSSPVTSQNLNMSAPAVALASVNAQIASAAGPRTGEPSQTSPGAFPSLGTSFHATQPSAISEALQGAREAAEKNAADAVAASDAAPGATAPAPAWVRSSALERLLASADDDAEEDEEAVRRMSAVPELDEYDDSNPNKDVVPALPRIRGMGRRVTSGDAGSRPAPFVGSRDDWDTNTARKRALEDIQELSSSTPSNHTEVSWSVLTVHTSADTHDHEARNFLRATDEVNVLLARLKIAGEKGHQAAMAKEDARLSRKVAHVEQHTAALDSAIHAAQTRAAGEKEVKDVLDSLTRLTTLCEDYSATTTFVFAGGIKIILLVIYTHEEMEIRRAGFEALDAVAQFHESHFDLRDKGVVEMALASMEHHPNGPAVTAACLRVLATLAAPSGWKYLRDHSAIVISVKAMVYYESSPEVLADGYFFLARMSEDQGTAQYVWNETAELILSGMRSHPDDAEVQIEGLRLLAVMARLAMRHPSMRKLGVVEQCLAAIPYNLAETEVVEIVVDLLDVLVEDADTDTLKPVLLAMRAHLASPQIQQKCLHFLSRVPYMESGAQRLLVSGAIECVVDVLDKLSSIPAIVNSAMDVLRPLWDEQALHTVLELRGVKDEIVTMLEEDALLQKERRLTTTSVHAAGILPANTFGVSTRAAKVAMQIEAEAVAAVAAKERAASETTGDFRAGVGPSTAKATHRQHRQVARTHHDEVRRSRTDLAEYLRQAKLSPTTSEESLSEPQRAPPRAEAADRHLVRMPAPAPLNPVAPAIISVVNADDPKSVPQAVSVPGTPLNARAPPLPFPPPAPSSLQPQPPSPSPHPPHRPVPHPPTSPVPHPPTSPVPHPPTSPSTSPPGQVPRPPPGPPQLPNGPARRSPRATRVEFAPAPPSAPGAVPSRRTPDPASGPKAPSAASPPRHHEERSPRARLRDPSSESDGDADDDADADAEGARPEEQDEEEESRIRKDIEESILRSMMASERQVQALTKTREEKDGIVAADYSESPFDLTAPRGMREELNHSIDSLGRP